MKAFNELIFPIEDWVIAPGYSYNSPVSEKMSKSEDLERLLKKLSNVTSLEYFRPLDDWDIDLIVKYCHKLTKISGDFSQIYLSLRTQRERFSPKSLAQS